MNAHDPEPHPDQIDQPDPPRRLRDDPLAYAFAAGACLGGKYAFAYPHENEEALLRVKQIFAQQSCRSIDEPPFGAVQQWLAELGIEPHWQTEADAGDGQ